MFHGDEEEERKDVCIKTHGTYLAGFRHGHTHEGTLALVATTALCEHLQCLHSGGRPHAMAVCGATIVVVVLLMVLDSL